MRPIQSQILLLGAIFLAACAPTKNLEVSNEFPVPLTARTPVSLSIQLDETLTGYVHRESFDKKGEWLVDIGTAQRAMFERLATGAFDGFAIVEELDAAGMDGILKPTIAEMQLALPSQTRSRFYEAWIRYEFQLYDRAGNLVGTWNLPAYGNASEKDYGSVAGLKQAALAACRDAMAFFSINFAREPVVRKWLADGKPIVPAAAPPAPAPATTPTPAPATEEEPDSNDSEGTSA